MRFSMNKYAIFKRTFDLILSLFGLILISPIMVSIAIAIKLDSRGPIFFKQKRFGKNKILFYIYKFRTMKINAPNDRPTHLLVNPETYITKIGRILRKTSLDELPQLINIVKGEMSIIGPRPALWNQENLMMERDKYGVNQITPGLTGWAQINGRDELPIEIKAKLDGEYLSKMSFKFDVLIFLRTIKSVLISDGVVEGNTFNKKDINGG